MAHKKKETLKQVINPHTLYSNRSTDEENTIVHMYTVLKTLIKKILNNKIDLKGNTINYGMHVNNQSHKHP